jgi:tripartite-type tricarboxylate transporter receptor subunit TctC
VPAEAVPFYQDLMRKVAETPEWKEYVARTAQSGRVLIGGDLTKFIDEDYARFQAVFKEEGWLVQ